MDFLNYILDANFEPGSEEGLPDMEALLRWSELFRASRDRSHLRDQFGPYQVSTVFLGLNHEWSQDRAPLLFETMVFDDETRAPFLGTMVSEQAADFGTVRYASFVEARAGHAAMCARVRAFLGATTTPAALIAERAQP